ncbi:STAS domain-containing protein [Nocardioides sp. IC4_145]|uniref:STAS domain-containing protein n=1 Tax=Nocardioides sp. IC4_145 TaxID=2714037 RepID=UPI00140BF910|nr:STAS domain-containing protein [Nocardioides sp. IC4_145]NHC24357.1 STAS domain-containing protein [Nocardioides sp. IC4_145]
MMPMLDGAGCRLVVVGEIDGLTASAFASALVDLFEAGTRFVEVDLSEVTFLGCAGVTALVEAKATASTRGVLMRVIDPSEPAGRVLRLTGAEAHLRTAAGQSADSGV